jgi:FlaA1/EpsC-like NDP-sugar epimerase
MLQGMTLGLKRLPRRWKSLILAGFDLFSLTCVLWLSFQLRIGLSFAPNIEQLILMALAPAVALPIFLRMGLYRTVIRYLPERAIWTILRAMTMATLSWVFILFLAAASQFGVLPRTVPIFYFLLGTIVVVGSRFAAKYLLYLTSNRQTTGRNILIYGAGEAGRQLASTMAGKGVGNLIGFLDDDRNLQGRDVSGLRTYAPSRLSKLIEDFGVDEIILSIPSLQAVRRQEIYSELSKFPVQLRTLPSLRDIASGKYQVSQLREFDIDELLGRSSVPADPALLKEIIIDRVVVVSGAGGSIGSELCRIIATLQPRKLVLLEASEFALYQIERQLLKDANFQVVPVLGSVTDEQLVRRTFRAHEPHVVFHAAAHKHVPLVEANALEGARNNILGTYIMSKCSFEAGVADFVLISTDKAVRPTNVMGATKRWAELIVSAFGDKAKLAEAGQRFSAVRFGNVLGSNGSVVPLFRDQIATGGPVTLTDEGMTRYFMSIHEAAELIIQAGTLSESGDIFLLEMGQPVKIRDLAENMIRLAGLTVRSEADPDGDIAIVVTGARPAEKLVEELFYDPSQAEPTRHPKILRAKMSERKDVDITAALGDLTAALEQQDEPQLRRILFGLIAD